MPGAGLKYQKYLAPAGKIAQPHLNVSACTVSACHKTIAKKLIGASITEICECVWFEVGTRAGARKFRTSVQFIYIWKVNAHTHTQNHRGVKSDCAVAEYHLNRMRQSEVKESFISGDICSRANPYSINYALFPNIAAKASVRGCRLGWRFASAGSNCTCCSPVTQPASATFTIFFVSPARLQLCVCVWLALRAIGRGSPPVVRDSSALLRCALLIWPISDAARVSESRSCWRAAIIDSLWANTHSWNLAWFIIKGHTGFTQFFSSRRTMKLTSVSKGTCAVCSFESSIVKNVLNIG